MSSDEQERRVHPRIEITSEVRVSGPRGVATGVLRDISKGGAGIFLKDNVGDVGDTVEIFLSFSESFEIAVMAEVLRIRETQQGLLHGFRFNFVEPAMQERLLGLLEDLTKSRVVGSKTRKHPRLSRRLPIKIDKPSELKVVLENISMGGLRMTVPRPFVLYEEVEISLPDLSGKEFLILNGRVIYQNPIEGGGSPTQYQVGIQFQELSPVADRCLKEFLSHILESEKK